jgi:hypothetical protein
MDATGGVGSAYPSGVPEFLVTLKHSKYLSNKHQILLIKKKF